MNDGESLRQAVLAEPDEDTPRLVYADWLDENGQSERAAFIRDQIEAVRAEPYSKRSIAAAMRAGETLKKQRGAWDRTIRGVRETHFERGFLAGLEIEKTETANANAEWFANEPIQTLRIVRPIIPRSGTSLHALFAMPQIRQIRRLEFSSLLEISPEEFTAIQKCPHLTGLRDLALSGNPVHPTWLAAVVGGGEMPELQGLNLRDIPNLGPGIVAALASATHRDIRRLDVTGVRFTSDELQRLLPARCLRKVEELRLGCFTLHGDPGPMFHLDVGWVIPWDRLTLLDLNGQRLGNEGVREIVRNSKATSLRWLGLSRNALSLPAISYLTESTLLNLNYFDVSGNGFGKNEVEPLKRRFPDAEIVW